LLLLAWQDTTSQILAWMQQQNGRLEQALRSATAAADRRRYQRALHLRNAYVEALSSQGSRTGLLVGERKR
jgi:hypothetical protein